MFALQWDTPGRERVRHITSAYFRRAVGFLLVFDLSSRKTFDALPSWLDEIPELAPGHLPTVMLVGNKCDVEPGKRQVLHALRLLLRVHTDCSHPTQPALVCAAHRDARCRCHAKKR